MYGMLDWLKAQRGWQRFDSVLLGGLLAVCENTRIDATTGHRVLLLFSERDALASSRVQTLEQRARSQIFLDLKSHPRIETDSAQWRVQFKPLHEGLTPENIAAYIARFTHGIPQVELLDAYPTVADDLRRLLQDGTIRALEYKEKSKVGAPYLVLFPRDDMGVKVDADLRAVWHDGIDSMPKGVELEAALFKDGHLTEEQFSQGHILKARQQAIERKMIADAVKAAAADKKLKRKRVSKGALTNTHLLGQYDFLSKLTATAKKK
jgi:hypothetical protein